MSRKIETLNILFEDRSEELGEPHALQFVEAETLSGKSVRVGKWVDVKYGETTYKALQVKLVVE